MEVLLINPRSGYLAEPAFLPPLGLLYLGTALEHGGHRPAVVDLNLEGSTIGGHDPRLIGISCVTANFPAVRHLVAECREAYPGVPILVGGPHLSVRPGDWCKLGADWGGSGDCEDKLGYLAATLTRGFDVPRGELPDWAPVDVDALPIPARHLVPIHEYRCTLDGEPATSLVTQRGCPFACAFCSRWEGSRQVRARSAENVIAEVRGLSALGFHALIFHDDEFNLSERRLLHLCGGLAVEHIRFRANVRADLLTETQAEALAGAGCSWLCVGVESGSAGILQRVQKGTTPAINARARKICRQAGIKFKAFVIAGLPGETQETLTETRDWLIENEVDDLTVTMFVGFPGTAIFEHPDRYEVDCREGYEDQPLTFRGMSGLPLPQVTSTSALSAEDLAEMPERLETEVRRELEMGRTYQSSAGVAAQ